MRDMSKNVYIWRPSEVYFDTFIVFTNIDNIGAGGEILFLCALVIEIWVKMYIYGGHFEIQYGGPHRSVFVRVSFLLNYRYQRITIRSFMLSSRNA